MNMRVLMYARNPPVRCRVGGVVSHQTLAIPLSVSGSEGNFEVSSVVVPGGLNPRFFCQGSGNAGIVFLESFQNNTDVSSCQSLLSKSMG